MKYYLCNEMINYLQQMYTFSNKLKTCVHNHDPLLPHNNHHLSQPRIVPPSMKKYPHITTHSPFTLLSSNTVREYLRFPSTCADRDEESFAVCMNGIANLTNQSTPTRIEQRFL